MSMVLCALRMAACFGEGGAAATLPPGDGGSGIPDDDTSITWAPPTPAAVFQGIPVAALLEPFPPVAMRFNADTPRVSCAGMELWPGRAPPPPLHAPIASMWGGMAEAGVAGTGVDGRL